MSNMWVNFTAASKEVILLLLHRKHPLIVMWAVFFQGWPKNGFHQVYKNLVPI